VSRSFTDRYGTELAAGGEASFPGCARLTVSKPCGVHLEASDFPALTGALYEGAGLPAPVILERPEVDLTADCSSVNIFTVTLEPNLRSVGIRYHGAPNRAIVAPGPARVLAAVIAAYADVAQANRDEPDPGEVEELAAAIRTAHHPHSGRPGDGDRTAARAALRWMRDKQQRGEAP